MTEQTRLIKEEVETFKKNNGGKYEDYYIGITKHIDQRLVENNEFIIEHLSNGEYTVGNPIYTAECLNRDEAVEIERFFQRKGMLKLNPRSVGVEASKFIYCYKMTSENKKAILGENEKTEMKHLIDYSRHTKKS